MYNDAVTLGDLVIPEQSIGMATKIQSRGFNYQGILGLGHVTLTEGRVSDNQLVPTVMDILVATTPLISEKVLGVYFIPSTEQTKQGKLTFGGFDHEVTTTTMHYVLATKIFSAGMYMGIELSITYGHGTILDPADGVIDTGATMVALATSG